jgi:hypothetical protein
MGVHHIQPSVRSHRVLLARTLVLFAVGILTMLLVSFGLHGQGRVASSEAQFTDVSIHGLAIVPASCPSDPHYAGECSVSPCQETYNCNVQADGKSYTYHQYDNGTQTGTCAYDFTSICATTCSTTKPGYCQTFGCPIGSTAQADGSCLPDTSATCPSGYTLQSGQCVSVDPALVCPLGYVLQAGSCTFSACPTGYTLQAGVCTFIRCPSGYTLQAGLCVAGKTCAVGNLCNPADGNIYSQDAKCNLTLVKPTCQYGCGSGRCNQTPAPNVVTFSLNPSLVQRQSSATITWDVKNAKDCAVTGSNGDSWSGMTGSQQSAPILGQTVYTLHCAIIPGAVNSDGTPAVWSDLTRTVNIVPRFIGR